MAMAMQCGAQATFVSAVLSRASRCPCRIAGSAPSLSVNPKSIRLCTSVHTPTWASASRARFNAKFSGTFASIRGISVNLLNSETALLFVVFHACSLGMGIGGKL